VQLHGGSAEESCHKIGFVDSRVENDGAGLIQEHPRQQRQLPTARKVEAAQGFRENGKSVQDYLFQTK
jgi:hypothetical protein